MCDALKIIARRELRTLYDLGDGGDWCDQKSALDCEVKQLGLRVVARKFLTSSLIRSNSESGSAPVNSCSPNAIQSLSRVAWSQKPCSQTKRISLAVKTPRGGAEEKSHRDEAVLRGPDQRDIDAGDFHAARDATHFGRTERSREDVRLRRHPNRLLRTDINMLPEAGAGALVMSGERGERGVGNWHADKPAESRDAPEGDPRRRRESAVRRRP